LDGRFVCSNVNGHLQAPGTLCSGHKQYRYYARWREMGDENKYQRMMAFGFTGASCQCSKGFDANRIAAR